MNESFAICVGLDGGCQVQFGSTLIPVSRAICTDASSSPTGTTYSLNFLSLQSFVSINVEAASYISHPQHGPKLKPHKFMVEIN